MVVVVVVVVGYDETKGEREAKADVTDNNSHILISN